MKNHKSVKRFSIFLLLILGTQLLIAQNKISGTIIGFEERTPIIGATIYLEGTTFGVATDKEGKYEITGIPDGTYKLNASYNGYETQEYVLDIYQNKVVHFRLEQSTIDNNAIVVTGTRTKNQLNQSPIRTRIIDKTTIKRQGVSSLAQALSNNVASFETTKEHLANRFTFNGLNPHYTLLLIDGERLAEGSEGIFDLSRINLSSIEQIEIIDGAASTLYGSNAIGGVINVITRDVSRPLEVNVGIQNIMFSDPSGSNGKSNQYAYANLNLRKDRLTSFTNVKYNKYSPYDINGGEGIFNVLTQEDENDYNLSQKLIFRVNNWISFNGNVAYYNANRNFQSTEIIDKKSNSFRYNFKTNLYPTDKLKFELSFLGDNNKTYDVINLGTSKRDSLSYKNVFQNARLSGNIKLFKFNNITVGAEYFSEKQTALPGNFQDKKIERYAIFFQDELFVSKNLTLVAGGRTENHSVYGTNFTPQFSILISEGKFSLRGNYGKGFRAPSIRELYSSEFMLPPNGLIYNKSVSGNPNLRPEISNFISASAQYSDEKLDVSASYSLNDINKLITLSDDYNIIMNDTTELPSIKSLNYTYENLNETTIQNIKTFVSYQFFKWLNANASYTFINAKDNHTDQALLNIRKHAARFNLNFNHIIRKVKVTANLNSAYFGSKNVVNVFSFERELIKLPGFVILNLMTTFTVKDHYTLNLGANNLLDKTDDQPQYLNSLNPGRMIILGASVSF